MKRWENVFFVNGNQKKQEEAILPLENELATHSSILAWKILMDRGAQQATIHEVTDSDVTEQMGASTKLCLNQIKQTLSQRRIRRKKEGHYITIKGSIQKQDVTFVNIYASKIGGAPKYIKQILSDLKEITHNNGKIFLFNYG